jgi:Pyruvate/2-oxoacid:ferredoxin oxidoreductase delta subunit
MNPEYVPTCRIGRRAGLGTCSFVNIEIVGDPVEEFIDKTFKVVRRPPLFAKGEGVIRYINNILMPRPIISPSLCTKCGNCITMCPVEPKAVNWTGGKRSEEPPKHNYSLCIRCFCCQETCPEKAISIVTPPMGRMLPILVTIGMAVGYFKSATRRTVKKIKKLLGI